MICLPNASRSWVYLAASSKAAWLKPSQKPQLCSRSRLNSENMLAEPLGLWGVVGALLKSGVAEPQPKAAIVQPLEVERGHQPGELARADDDVFGGHPDVTQYHVAVMDTAIADVDRAAPDFHARH